MQAITQHRYGTAEVLQRQAIDVPVVGPNEVLVQVQAAGVDRGTWHLMTGLPYLIRLIGYGLTGPKHPVPGLDVAGTVVEVGDDVTRFQVGDEVFGIAQGSFAEYAAADEAKLARKPANITFEQAAVSAVSGITALEALTDVGNVQAGQRVLVVGASGGVGTFAVQLAKALGARVTGVSGPAMIDTVRALGADQVFDHTTEDFVESDERYDLVLDIGGRNSISRLRRVLAPRGTLVIVGGEGGNRLTGGVGRQVRAMALSPFLPQRLTTFVSSEHHSNIERLGEFLAAGTVVPHIGRRFTLDQVADAMDQIDAGAACGKSVVVVDAEGESRAT